MPTDPLTAHGSFGRFTDRLLALDLPDLPADRRERTTAFVCRRGRDVPSPLRIGLIALVVTMGGVARLIGQTRTTDVLGRTRLPILAELARMVRSLGFAYVWETWPGTSPTGAPEPEPESVA